MWVTATSNPTTGYEWIVEDESCGGKVNISQDYEPDDKSGTLMGGGGVATFKLSAVEEGKCTFRAAYDQYWEFDGFENDQNASYDFLEIPVIVSSSCEPSI